MHYPTTNGFPVYPAYRGHSAGPHHAQAMAYAQYVRGSSKTAPALFVVGSFAMMVILAGVLSVVGSVAAQAILDGDPAGEQTVAPSTILAPR